MSDGSGWILMDLLLVLLCTSAAVLQIAVYRDRTIGESHLMESGRIVLFTGYLLLSARFVFLFVSHGDVLIPPITEVGIALLAIGHICFALNRLRTS